MSKRILFVSAHAPTDKYPQAGQKIAFNHLIEYHEDNIDIDVVVIANHQEIEAATDLFQQYSQRLFSYPLSKISKTIRCIIGWKIPFKFTTRYHRQVAKHIQQLLNQNHYHIIHFEYSHAAVYIDLLLNYLSQTNHHSKTEIIISIHDILTQSILRQAREFPLLGIEAARIFKYEKFIYDQATQLWVLSAKDHDILTSLYSINPDKIFVKPPKLSSFLTNIKRKQTTIQPKTLMFWGAMNRPDNEKAVSIFIEQCFNALLQIDKEYKLYIVGSHPSERLRSRRNQNIVITGFVEDPTSYFAMVEWGVVPLVTGAGIKLKTLEMLAAGIPVISTAIGAEGVDASTGTLIINDNIQEWVNLILNHQKQY